ncbi:myosin-2 heavy chain-like isoform X2 [Notolabrus celidotus]|uniref:myosin-2 heavy chain-like isoform X1 n=1 Tax=Notolabrus celidotus TaxID=1203425 RepID=UPI00148F7AB5|nr:myosin-2 heavy chain-like isoform X1 [Notolabrus celidotus]XP_034567377.1 myosin-2 heavy chain-like isoform X2 [Notolabrus celidotus]
MFEIETIVENQTYLGTAVPGTNISQDLVSSVQKSEVLAVTQPQVGRKCKQKLKHLNTKTSRDLEEPLCESGLTDRQIPQREPVTPPQQDPKTKAKNPSESFYQMTGAKMVEVFKVDSMSDKDELTITLEREQAALRAEAERLKERTEIVKAEGPLEDIVREIRLKRLQLDLIDAECREEEVLLKVSQLEDALEKEKENQKEAQKSLAQEKEENTRLAAALTQAEEDLKRETLQWQEESTGLLQSIQDHKQALRQNTVEEDMMRRLECLTQQLAMLGKKTKKPSLMTRFFNLFK